MSVGPVVAVKGVIDQGIEITCSTCGWMARRAANPDPGGHMPESTAIAQRHADRCAGDVVSLVFNGGDITHDHTATGVTP